MVYKGWLWVLTSSEHWSSSLFSEHWCCCIESILRQVQVPPHGGKMVASSFWEASHLWWKSSFYPACYTKNSGIMSDLMNLDLILIPEQISTLQMCGYVKCYTWSNISSWAQKWGQPQTREINKDGVWRAGGEGGGKEWGRSDSSKESQGKEEGMNTRKARNGSCSTFKPKPLKDIFTVTKL